MDATLAKIYYGPRGYWKGVAAIKKLAKAAKVPEEVAKKWLIKQALWQIFLPVPRRIPRPKFDVPTHPHLCQLTDSDSNLKRPSDCDPRLPTFQLIRLSDLVKIRVIRASQGSVDYLLVFGVNHVCLPLQSFNELPVRAVSQQFEHFSEKRLAFIHVSCPARLRHLLHEPGKDLGQLVVDCSVNLHDYRPLVHVPQQQRGVY